MFDMVSDSDEFPSRNQINKAGKLLRETVAGRVVDVDPREIQRAVEVVTRFRDAHGYPMTKVRAGLASMVATEGIDAAVSQRHKRVPRIVRKLMRMHGTALVRLEDIGGCRVVVANPEDMDTLCRRIRKNWSGSFTRPERDYVADPKQTGYRARHFVVKRDARAIEIQVRTVGQQRWADAVESIDARLKLNLKDGAGPDSLMENFKIAGELIFRQEWGLEIGQELVDSLVASNDLVVREGYYTG